MLTEWILAVISLLLYGILNVCVCGGGLGDFIKNCQYDLQKVQAKRVFAHNSKECTFVSRAELLYQ